MNLHPGERAVAPQEVTAWKRDARALADAKRIKLTAALAQVAQREGFKSWVRVVYCAGGGNAVDAAAASDKQPNERRIARRLMATLGNRPGAEAMTPDAMALLRRLHEHYRGQRHLQGATALTLDEWVSAGQAARAALHFAQTGSMEEVTA